MINKNNPEVCWISLILRVSVAVLFGFAAYSKFAQGLDKYAVMMFDMFKDTFLPGPLLRAYITVLPYVEALVTVWLLVGFKLRAAWVSAAFLMISLAMGLMIAKQTAADMFIFLGAACAGLYFSKYDGCGVACCGKKD